MRGISFQSKAASIFFFKLLTVSSHPSVKHCKWVDEVVYPCPWIITQEFIDSNNIDYVAHDVAPYSSNGCDDIYGFVKKIGKFRETKRTDGISTSDVIMRILKDRDGYTLRNLKRGYTREQLGISYFEELLLKAKSALAFIEKKVIPCQRRKKATTTTTKDKK